MPNIFVHAAEAGYVSSWAHLLKERGYDVTVAGGDARPPRGTELIIVDLQPTQPLMAACALVNKFKTSTAADLLVMVPRSWSEQHTQAMELRPRECIYKPMDCASVVRLVDMIFSSKEYAAGQLAGPAGLTFSAV